MQLRRGADRAAPGFVGNRLQFALLREALHIVKSGIASAEVVDQVMRASLGRRYAMVGPLEAADMTGLSTVQDICLVSASGRERQRHDVAGR